ncbi:concanavalin A-like lectin/glucanase domain-containing protein [Leptodontidium sp. 2 PMI_412]|nr:concanavalin A-like lectin/glucanase domain-containing protein [Leptodontidium sp. 2 PMI_412]
MSQKPLPSPDPAKRRHLSETLLKGARIPKAPPKDFSPLEGTKHELKSYGLPLKPDEKAHPGRYARWAKNLSKPLTFVSPTFKIIEDKRITLPHQKGKVKDDITSGNWSGFVTTNLDSGDQFNLVEGEWIAPNAYPNSSGADGDYLVSNWIGIDGWNSGDVLQAGTTSQCIVSGGVITSQSATPWFEWYPAFSMAFSNFTVLPGDTIWGYIYAESSTVGFAFLMNVGAGTYTSITFDAPAGTSLQGNSAEWIVEDPSNGTSEYQFPDYGSTFFFDCYAFSGSLFENLTSGFPVTLDQGGGSLSTPTQEGTDAFRVTYV